MKNSDIVESGYAEGRRRNGEEVWGLVGVGVGKGDVK